MTPPVPVPQPSLQEQLTTLAATVATLTDANDALTARVAALEAPPVLTPTPGVPADQRGLPIPPKRLREPEHAPVRTTWGDLGLFKSDVGAIVETVTGTKPDPQRPPKQPGYLDRLKRPGIS